MELTESNFKLPPLDELLAHNKRCEQRGRVLTLSLPKLRKIFSSVTGSTRRWIASILFWMISAKRVEWRLPETSSVP